jgi:septum formation protein
MKMKHTIILGSKSPRRQEILKMAGFNFSVLTTDEDEVIAPGIAVEDIPVYLAQQKARFIQPKIDIDNYVLITADTIVVLDNEIIGKPRDLEEAKLFLKKLSGQTHTVISGVCLTTSNQSIFFSDVAKVHFKDLSPNEIDFYIQNCEVLDKAGAYGVQDWIGLIGIKSIEGSFYNIMGLPIQKVYEALHKLD